MGDVVEGRSDFEPAHRSVALGACRNVIQENMADEPGPGFSGQADTVVVMI